MTTYRSEQHLNYNIIIKQVHSTEHGISLHANKHNVTTFIHTLLSHGWFSFALALLPYCLSKIPFKDYIVFFLPKIVDVNLSFVSLGIHLLFYTPKRNINLV